MPEGDTVFKLAQYLKPALSGRPLRSGWVNAPRVIELAGRVIEDVYSRGKHLFLALDDGTLLRSHLGMWGSWHGYAAGEDWKKPASRASIILDVGERVFVCFNARQVELLRQAGVRKRALDLSIGPDLLDDSVDYPAIIERSHALAAAETPLIDLLLDQRIASGVGNVYKSEVLFVERRHPLTRRATISDDALSRLYRTASRLMGRNTRDGPRMTRWANDGAGGLWVYGRTGRTCLRCGQAIRSARLGRGMRSTFWCPRCQARR